MMDKVERSNAIVIASHGFAINDAGAGLQAGQCLNDQREAMGEVIARTCTSRSRRPVHGMLAPGLRASSDVA
jgi:hypothetical protein